MDLGAASLPLDCLTVMWMGFRLSFLVLQDRAQTRGWNQRHRFQPWPKGTRVSAAPDLRAACPQAWCPQAKGSSANTLLGWSSWLCGGLDFSPSSSSSFSYSVSCLSPSSASSSSFSSSSLLPFKIQFLVIFIILINIILFIYLHKYVYISVS